ncbi:hypothetical protein C7212DRAFT_76493, partial [Tuber magnatum]
RHEWPTLSRTRILTMMEVGISESEAAQHTGVPQQTISRWARQEPPSERWQNTRSGRPRKLNPRDLRHLIRILRWNWEGRRLSWAKLGQEAGLKVPSHTIQSALAIEGYTRCKACKKPFIDHDTQKARLAYSVAYSDKPTEWWRKHIYSDEV